MYRCINVAQTPEWLVCLFQMLLSSVLELSFPHPGGWTKAREEGVQVLLPVHAQSKPFGKHQESRPLVEPDFLSMRRVFVSYS